MAKKNPKTKRRKRALKADPNRQANASLRGYRYQILHSVDAWLDLTEDETLYLEGVEDFDIVSDSVATLVQVKDTQHNITLRSKDVIDAINHYWESLTKHPDLIVKFRFITRSKIGREKDNPFGDNQSGLRIWNRCSGDEETIAKISKFLQNQEKISDDVKKFLKQEDHQEIYKRLIEPVTWETGSKDANSIKKSISGKLFHHGNKLGLLPFDSNKVLDALLNEAFTMATHGGNRELTKECFHNIIAEETTQRVSTQHLRHLQMQATQATMSDSANATLISGSSDITFQSQSPIQTDIPPLYPDVIERTELLKNIQTKLQSEGIVVIQGGTGKGKTTLAKLIAENLNGSWFWLNFTNKNSLQILQYLQQLTNVISNESAQINVVLDDLNLQPQHLREYEEILGVVIYRVLERGAKLLITSQHEPPSDLIRRLGLPSTVIIGVPNFTMPEIEQFAEQMGCPTNDIKTWTTFIQAHTGGHPRLVHARLAQLREEGWKQPDTFESMIQIPQEVKKERETSRQLLADYPKDKREFLYRLSLLSTGFRKDYAINIGEIPEVIPDPGDVFSQLVGPWIDQINETYYTISPLLKDAAKEVWSDEKIKELHRHIADAIIKTKELTPTDAWTVFTHSLVGQYKEGIIAFIYSFMTASQDDWKNLCQEFSLLAHIKTEPPEELFPGDTFVNQMFRSLQYRIAVEVEPELAPKILEIWDKETKPYEPRQSYLLSRLMLATEVLRYTQVLLPVKKMVGYLKEMINIKDSDKDVWETFDDSMGELEGHKTEKSNYFSILFGFIYARQPIYAPFLDELIDVLDELDLKTRALLLADFEDDTVDTRVLVDGIWRAEANLENPDWTRCLQVFDKVIEKTIDWGYPHFAAAAARTKAMIHDEDLQDPDTAHQVLQDFVSIVGPSPIIEEQQAVIYLHQERYNEALNIYERILPDWNPPSGHLDLMPSEGCRRAAMCAAHLDDWKKAATFFEEGAKRTHKTVNPERNIGFYADTGFAHFKAGNMLNCIKFLHLALENFEKLPQNETDIKYFTLKKRLEHTIKWIRQVWYGLENTSPLPFEPSVGFCSDPETKKEFLDLPDCPIGYTWLYLSQIEYRFGHETTVYQHALQTPDREEYPFLNSSLSFLQTQYDFKNMTFYNLPQRIYQLAQVFSSMKKHQQSGRGAAEKGSYSISNSDLSDFASVENINLILVSALLVQLPIDTDIAGTLSMWRANSSELPIKDNIFIALDLIESILSGNHNNTLTVMRTQDSKGQKRLVAALKVVESKETNPESLFLAHTFIATSLIDTPWEDFVAKGLARLLSAQWLEKIKSGWMSLMNTNIIQQIEQACNSSETGKKKIGQILLAAYPVVTTKVDTQTFQQFRTWAESDQKQESEKRKNPAAQRLIKAMEKPPHLTDEDIEVLNQSIKEGEIPIKFDSPFEMDEPENNE